MGSDYYMNPPKKKWEIHTASTEEEVMEWVIGAMAMGYEIHISRYNGERWNVNVFKGEWI